MENEIISGRFEEILKIVKGLSTYEARVFHYIATTGNTIPSIIVKDTKVPQSKIYGVLKSLHSLNLIEKNDEKYAFNSSVLIPIQLEFNETFSELSKHLDDTIKRYSISENPVVEKLIASLKNLRYVVESKGRLDSHFQKKTSRYFDVLMGRFDKSKLPQLIIATSSTSVNRVGILIFTDDTILKKTETLFLLQEILRSLHLDKTIILINNVSEKMKDLFPNVTYLSLLGDYTNRLAAELETFDEEWRKSINHLKTLDKLVDVPNRRINNLTTKITEARYLVRQIDNEQLHSSNNKHTLWIPNAFDEIIDRVDADVKSAHGLFLQLKLECMVLQNDLTENKSIPEKSETEEIKNEVGWLLNELDYLEVDLSTLLDEILNILRGSRYQKVGFVANPFVFTIPISKSLQVVGQDDALEELSDFITDISTNSSANNVALIVDEQGMGKTHLMTHFLDKINNGSLPNTAGLFIRCRPNNDFFTIYNEIRVAVEKLPDSPLKMGLISILRKSDYPLTINQFSDILRNLSQIAYDLGKTTFILFIDEFENLFSSEIESQAAAQQLKYLSETPHVGFIVSLRKSDWRDEPKLRKILSEIPPKFISLKKLDVNSIKTILNNRLELLSIDSKPKITFELNTIETIAQKSHGNIRKALTLAREAFRKTVQANETKITTDMLVDDSENSDDNNSVNELQMNEKEVK